MLLPNAIAVFLTSSLVLATGDNAHVHQNAVIGPIVEHTSFGTKFNDVLQQQPPFIELSEVEDEPSDCCPHGHVDHIATDNPDCAPSQGVVETHGAQCLYGHLADHFGHKLVRHLPHKHPAKVDTIYHLLSTDPKFSLVSKAIAFVDEALLLLNDTSANVTFFAPPDSALRPHHKHHRHEESTDDPEEHIAVAEFCSTMKDVDANDIPTFAFLRDINQVISMIEQIERTSNVDDDSGYRCKEHLKLIIRALLAYHILPDNKDLSDLSSNSTFATNLTLPVVQDGQPIRIRVEHGFIPSLTTINLFSKIIRPNVRASNGVIHVVNHPLIPPPPVFQGLFLAPDVFSTLTSTIQRTGLTDKIDLRYVHREKGKGGNLEGVPSVTIFAPTNLAFHKLPLKLKLFLFSSFGETILKKLLQFHISPKTVFYSDYLHTPSADNDRTVGVADSIVSVNKEGCPIIEFDEFDIASSQHFDSYGSDSQPFPPSGRQPGERRHQGGRQGGSMMPKLMQPRTIAHKDITLPSLLTNHSLHAHIEKATINVPLPGPPKPEKVDTKIYIEKQRVHLPDLVALNGAIHVIDNLLDPRCKHQKDHGPDHYVDVWEEWEEWLIQWADEI